MEYVSASNRRKDYDENYRKYERDLHVPYYLVFDPENQKLTVFHLEADTYTAVAANAAGRLAIPELELEAAIHDGWVRFWHRGELLPLPGELLNQLKAKDDQLDAARAHVRIAEQCATTAEAELA